MSEQLQTINDEILDQLKGYADTETKPEGLVLKRIEREITKLLKVDAASAYMLHGMLESLLKNTEESISWHVKSLRIANDLIYHTNFITSLEYLGYLIDSKPFLDDAYNKHPNSLVLLERLCSIYFQLGEFDQFDIFYNKILKITGSDEQQHSDDLKNILKNKSFIEENIELVGFKETMHAVYGVIKQYKKSHYYEDRLTLIGNEFILEKVISTDGNTIADMNIAFCELMAEQPNQMVDNLTFLFRSAE